MQNEIQEHLQEELKRYRQGSEGFPPYYPGMKVLSSKLYKKQLQEALESIKNQDAASVRNFEMYLDTIIINMQTKIKKYKKSLYFDDENIKDIQNQGYTIPFYIDEVKKTYVLLGLVSSQVVTQ